MLVQVRTQKGASEGEEGKLREWVKKYQNTYDMKVKGGVAGVDIVRVGPRPRRWGDQQRVGRIDQK